MNINPKQKLLLKITVFLLLGLISMFALWYTYAEIGRASASIQEIQSQINSLEEQNKSARKFQLTILEQATEIKRINNFFIDKEKPVEFIENLEGLAKTTGNRLSLNITPAGESKEFTFQLTIEGAEKNVRQYLKLIELVPYEIRIHSLNFRTEQSAASQPSQLSLAIKVKTK